MHELDKFLRKLSAKERARVFTLMQDLQNNPSGFNGKKLTGSNLYRARKGRYRFIYYFDQTGQVYIETIRLRDEKTYRDI